MFLATSGSWTGPGIVGAALGIVGAAAFVASYFWAKLGQAQIELLRTGNEAAARRIDELDAQVKAVTAENEKLKISLKQANEQIEILKRLVTGVDAIADLERHSAARHAEVLAAISLLTRKGE